MKNKIRVKTIINLFNIIVILNYTTGFTNFYKVGLQKVNFTLDLFSYSAIIFSIIYLLNKVYTKKNNFLLYSGSSIIFGIMVLIFSLISCGMDFYVIFKVFTLIGTIFYAVYLVNYYKFAEMIYLFFNAQFIVTIVSIMFINIFPGQGIMMYEGIEVIRAAYIHKNLLGANMAFGILVSIVVFRVYTKRTIRLKAIFLILSSILLIFIAQSMTSIMILIITIIISLIYKKYKIKFNPTLVMLIINFITYYIVFQGEKIKIWFEEMFNRSLSLTGRSDIWINAIDVITKKVNINYSSLIGYGYSNVWRDGSEIQNYLRAYTFKELTGSHNGFLEWILQIGIIGVILLIGIIVLLGHRAIKIRRIYKEESNWIIMFISYILIYYITERSFEPLNYQTLMMFSVINLGNKCYFRKVKKVLS